MAQSFNLEFDHKTIFVKNIEKSSEFYKNILQLKELETPWGFIEWGRFFKIGNHQQLHVALIDQGEVKPDKWLHLAFAVNDFDGYLKFLNDKNIKYGNFAGDNNEIQIRPDSVRQIYFQDPDGYWIEVNDAKH
jgi:catechol 2,3-dioxygenase-like lactoylglutathione lyase family enzyme